MSRDALDWFGLRISSTVAGFFSAQPRKDSDRIRAASAVLGVIACPPLFELQVRALDEILPLLDVGVEELPEVRPVVLEERDAGLGEVRARLGLLEHGFDVARDARPERGVDRCGREESLPQRRLVLWKPLLGDRGHVRRRGVALFAG